jgi:hypothetical protein
METTTGGAPGLLLIAFSWIFSWVEKIGRSDLSFGLSTLATLLAIIYYLLQIKKLKATQKRNKRIL